MLSKFLLHNLFYVPPLRSITSIFFSTWKPGYKISVSLDEQHSSDLIFSQECSLSMLVNTRSLEDLRFYGNSSTFFVIPSTFLTIFFVSPISLWVRELNFCWESTMLETSSLTVPLNCSSCLGASVSTLNIVKLKWSKFDACVFILAWVFESLAVKLTNDTKKALSLFDALHIWLVGEAKEEAGNATVHPAVCVPLPSGEQ